MNPPALIINDAPKLDPIIVILFNYEPGRGRIIIQCFSKAWTAYWGAMNGRTIEQFFMDCDADYLAGNMAWPDGARMKKSDSTYLERIIVAVQAALKERLNANV